MGRHGRQKYKAKSKNPVAVKTDKGHHRWTKGNASLANPTTTAFRSKAKSNWRATANNPGLAQSIQETLSGQNQNKKGKTTGRDLLKLHNLASYDDNDDHRSVHAAKIRRS